MTPETPQELAPAGRLDLGALAYEAIARANLADGTKHQYSKAVDNALAAGVDLGDPDALNAYAATIGSSSRAFLSAVVAKMTQRLELVAKSGATPANVAAVQATIYRAEALRDAVTVEKPEGTKAHTWLSQAEVVALLRACDVRRSGNQEHGRLAQRDRLAISLLVGAGLRRAEAAALTFEDITMQPVAGKMRTVLEVQGKGAKSRVVPVSDALARQLDDWSTVTHGRGRVLRSLGRNRQMGDSISTTSIYKLVQKRGGIAGRDGLEPHDLRRTFAQLGYEAGVPITQISVLLGHADVATTQRYLNLELDLETTVSDFIPLDC
jgi:integrase